jgi:hypothetical protein
MPGRVLAALLLVGLCGCVQEAERLALVPSDPAAFQHRTAKPPEGAAPPNQEIARRVGTVGQQLMAGNRCLDVRPSFSTVGVPQEELFHSGVEEIYISDGLVAHCQTDGQLAALLALELGRAVAQRDVAAGPCVSRHVPRVLPADVAGNNDTHGSFGPADGTRMMELARMEKEARTPSVPAEPETLARIYLRRAGFDEADLKVAETLAQLADTNGKLGRPTPTPARTP